MLSISFPTRPLLFISVRAAHLACHPAAKFIQLLWDVVPLDIHRWGDSWLAHWWARTRNCTFKQFLCFLPFLFCLVSSLNFQVFAVFTDSSTNCRFMPKTKFVAKPHFETLPSILWILFFLWISHLTHRIWSFLFGIWGCKHCHIKTIIFSSISNNMFSHGLQQCK